MEQNQAIKPEVLQYIVEEVDAARDILQLYLQLRKALPIRNFEDLYKACDKEGKLHFRDVVASHSIFHGLIPEFIFPIEDDKGLIIRLAQFVKVIPDNIGYDVNKPENIKRVTQMNFLSNLFRNVKNFGMIGGAGIKENTEMHKIASKPQE